MKWIAPEAKTGHHAAVNLHSFDLNLLRVLDALLITHSVSGAARRLELSQPATSAALSRLRAALNDPLLVRAGNRMTPTPLAEELRQQVARILEDVDRALTAVARFDPATTRRRFRIGANDYASAVLLVPLATRVREAAPGATIEILPMERSPDLSLATRELDLLVADQWTLRGIRGLETLFHETFTGIARTDHPRLPRRVTLNAFLAEDHVLLAPRGLSTGVVDRALEARGRARRVAMTVPHYLVAPAIVARSDLIMTIPRRLADCLHDSRRLRQFRPPIPLKGFDVVMAFDLRSDADPAIQWLKGLLRDTAASLCSGDRKVRG